MSAWQRFRIYRLYIPFRDLAHGVRSASRSLREKLGLRKKRANETGWKLPTVHWSSISRSNGALFLETDKADGNVNLTELAVLNALCQTHQPKEIFEIGTFDGRTTLNLALNSDANVHTLDLPAEELDSAGVIGADKRYVDKPSSGARFTSPPHNALPCVKRITQLLGDSAKFDFSPWHGKIDLVFVDGAHSYDFVVNDSEVALKLLNPAGGVIVWHDYGVWPDVAQALKELKEKRPDLPLVHVKGTSLAVSVSVKRV